MTTTQLLTGRIRSAAVQLKRSRERVESDERELMLKVAASITANPNGLRDWARQIGITPQYACDIRHGRRKISQAVLKKILGEANG